MEGKRQEECVDCSLFRTMQTSIARLSVLGDKALKSDQYVQNSLE